MAKFFLHGTPPKQTRSFIGQQTGLKINKTVNESGIAQYSEKFPSINTYVVIDPRIVRLYKTPPESNINDSITMGFDSALTRYNGGTAQIGLNLDTIESFFANKDDTLSDNLVFGYPIKNSNTIEISTSLMEAKFMARRKNSDGEWADVIDISNDEVIFNSNDDANEVKIFFMVTKMSGLPDTYMININGETMQIMEDLAFSSIGNHTLSTLYDAYTYHGLAGQLIGPIFIGANEYGNGIISCPKHSFKIRPYQTKELENIGIDLSKVTLTVKTNLSWQKLDNGDYEFKWKDESDMTPKYLSLQIAQNPEIDFHESTRIAMNFTVNRE